MTSAMKVSVILSLVSLVTAVIMMMMGSADAVMCITTSDCPVNYGCNGECYDLDQR